ncbi:MAG: hypothetical protein WBL93_07545 [Lutisporaceae bacterium]
MGLLNIININDDRKEHKALRTKNKAFAKRNYGYSVYESLEYGKNTKVQNGFGLQFDMFRSYVR